MSQDQIDNVRILVNQAYPCAPPWDKAFFPGNGTIQKWLDAGSAEQKIATGLIAGLDALRKGGKGPDGPGPAVGQWQGLRHDAYTGHFTEQDILEPYFIAGDPFPTDAQFWAQVYANGDPVSPAPVVTPSALTPEAKIAAIKAILG